LDGFHGSTTGRARRKLFVCAKISFVGQPLHPSRHNNCYNQGWIAIETSNSLPPHMITGPLNEMIFNSLYFAVIQVKNNPEMIYESSGSLKLRKIKRFWDAHMHQRRQACFCSTTKKIHLVDGSASQITPDTLLDVVMLSEYV
jgi:uncharacterized protein YchJ